jgi:hypothetical protein
MDAEILKEICVESCENVYTHISILQASDPNIGRSETKVERFHIHGDYALLHTNRKILDTGALGLSIGGKSYFEPDVSFEQFDEKSLTVLLYPSEEVMNILRRSDDNKREVFIITDLKWLISRTKNYYESFGDLIGYPKFKPKLGPDACKFPKDLDPSDEQVRAVETILKSELTYIWGAPGTGKTQFVLATAMMAYLREGKKVAIFAPTNNSLEQVLRGLLKIIKKEDPRGKIVDLKRDIIRIGSATAEFVKDYSDVCEKRGINSQIRSKEESLTTINNVIFERKCDILKAHFDEISVLMGEEYENADYFAKGRMMSQIRKYIWEIKNVLKSNEDFKCLADDFDEYNLKIKSERIAKALYERDRPALGIEMYRDMTNEELDELVTDLKKELSELEEMDPIVKMRTAKILAMTPQVFMGRFAPFSDSYGRVGLNVDHIFIDEIGYCNVINILPLFASRIPITMLGDHLQLPPVCEVKSKTLREGIEKNNKMRYAFMWEQSALFAESYLFKEIEDLQKAYLELSNPEFKRTERADLTISHRFGNNFAEILNECIYKNGITGIAEHPLEIKCIDAVCNSKRSRENMAEVKAIREYLVENELSLEEFVILTPYKNQVELLNKSYPELKNNILTVHKSQGREWNTVILSVSDPGSSDKEFPLRLTSTVDESSVGRKVINTAVSRAKKNLVIVCDKEFWSEKEGELIGKLASHTQ